MLAYPTAAVHVVGYATLDASLDQSVARLLKVSSASTSDAIAVAGPGAGAAMSALWRRGYERVEAARRVTCACADQQSDMLMILRPVNADQASVILDAVLPILRPEGVVTVDASGLSLKEREQLCRVLAHRGLRHASDAVRETEILAYRPAIETLALAS